jgi:hypothetical protein
VKRLLVAVGVLLGLLLVADRVAPLIADDRVAARVQQSAGLREPPEVELHGFPFLTQAIRGRYERIEVHATDVRSGDLTLARLDTTLRGAEISLPDALYNRPVPVPAAQVEAEALVAYDELTRRQGSRELTVTPRGDRLRVTGEVVVLGQTLRAAAVSSIEVVDGELVVTAESFEVGNSTANRLLTDALRGVFDFRVPLEDLPYGLRLQEASVTDEGILLRATGRDTVLPP